ncbi:asparagine synthase (glutamine-hydrolyzing) [Glaciimonas sp. PCH181]|uniref:asparagine synthase (glutamine-hydrolyzing) n=1 Tax=Glaciimonas sp. PCH181 TaxID=2133943 RepID=UPI000D388C34|nr:asparagine synthase (glutamine-hydrolyzing) [Glaciimonas sp. PCH181]PUA16912.1 asparagine synthase (glutamine-hydrolyzing) [Glaciimonas sp. PCH181]
MCGFTGFWSEQLGNIDGLEAIATRMAKAIQHRGPDDSGAWADADVGIALGHRRLSIVDLSPAGHQPMASVDGRFVMAFNGEIYNHLAIRAELQTANVAPAWRGHSDTETLLAAFQHYGVEATLTKTVGMFAIALWDREEKQLYLARDRMGEKPLYYGWSKGGFVFGSELKAIRQYPGFDNEIDRDALTLYFRHSYIPAPYSIYKNVFKLEPGCLLVLKAQDLASPPSITFRAPASIGTLQLSRWWSLHAAVEAGQASQIADEKEALKLLEVQLRESIRLQSVADVPLGAFLSGGVDSSLIVALMQAESTKPVHTYTIGFKEAAYDEAVYARAVAQHLQTKHTELYVSAADGLGVISKLSSLYDEPFADSSQIPTFLVAQQARAHVTVALSGDAGDELFAGYNRHLRAPHVWSAISKVPAGGRRLISKAINGIPPQTLNAVGQNVLPKRWQTPFLADKLTKLADRLGSVKDRDDLYYSLVSEWSNPSEIVVEGVEPSTLLSRRSDWPGLAAFEERMMYLDSMTYLPDDILAKVDRAAMGVSLETRVPFLDHRVVELAWRIPLKMKINNGQGKQVLRDILYKYVPRELIERPKQGFGIPLGAWLRGPLREWAEALLDRSRLKHEGYLNPDQIRIRWEEHIANKRNWEHSLWSVLMFQSWLEDQR